MRVGIDTGEVVVSSLDDRPGQDFVVVGDTVNRAARIQAAAPPGGIQISRDTHRHVRGWFSFTDGRAAAAQGDRRAGRGLPGRVGTPGQLPPRRGPGRGGRRDADDRPRGLAAAARRTSSGTSPRNDGGGWSRSSATRASARAGCSWSSTAGWPRSTSDCTGSGGGRRRARRTSPTGCSAMSVAARLEIQERDSPAAVREKLEAGFGTVFGTGGVGPPQGPSGRATGWAST